MPGRNWANTPHNFLSFTFTAGIVLMFLTWVARNLPTRVDVEWIKRGGGMLGGAEPPAYKFNAGEKLIFWLVVFGGGSVAASGLILLFPFYGTGDRKHGTGPDCTQRHRRALHRRSVVHIYWGRLASEDT